MKEVKAIIQPHMLTKVMDSLHELPHFPGVTVSDCQGQGRGLGRDGQFQATPESVFFVKKLKLEVICTDAMANEIVGTMQKAAHTGHPGDGVIVVTDVDQIIRIRSGEQGDGAI